MLRYKYYFLTLLVVLTLLVSLYFSGAINMLSKIAQGNPHLFTDYMGTMTIEAEPYRQLNMNTKRGYFAFMRGNSVYVWSSKLLESYPLDAVVGYSCLPEFQQREDGTKTRVSTAYLDLSNLPLPPKTTYNKNELAKYLQRGDFLLLITQNDSSNKTIIKQVNKIGC